MKQPKEFEEAPRTQSIEASSFSAFGQAEQPLGRAQRDASLAPSQLGGGGHAVGGGAQGMGAWQGGRGADAALLAGLKFLAELLYFQIDRVISARVEGGKLPVALGMVAELNLELGDISQVPEAMPALPAGGILGELSRRFALNPFEALLLIAAAAPAFDARFAACFQFLNGEQASKRASADLVAQLLGMGSVQRIQAVTCLSRGHHLHVFALLNLDWSEAALIPLHRQPLMMAPRLLWYLLDGSTSPPPGLAGVIHDVKCRWSLDDVPLEPSTLLGLRHYINAFDGQRAYKPLLVLEGPIGSGKKQLSEALAAHYASDLLECHLGEALFAQGSEALAGVLMREAILKNALLFLNIQSGDVIDDKGDGIITEQQYRRVLHFLEVEISAFPKPIIITGDYAALAMVSRLTIPLRTLRLTLPDRQNQRRLILGALSRNAMGLSDEDLEDILSRYNLDHRTVDDVISAARAISHTRDPEAQEIGPRHLEQALETVLSHSLSTLSERMVTKAQWDDLLLPSDLMVQLKALHYLIEHRFQIFDEWGLKKVGAGRGVKALFSGPSGTGKTLAAEVISGDLRVPLYRVDMSQLVSKWVGETEKNIDKIFRDAQASQAILLFDEADSLFGNRGAVEGGNDRWANFQVNYLLQRFETHDGVVLLTSNMPNAIDTAFARRMHFVVEFRLPDEEMRKSIWERALDPKIPMENDIDVPYLAERFELSAANIKNVVMAGVFLAASEGDLLNMKHLVRGMQLEFHKLGRGVSRGDFGPYFKYLDLEPY